MWWPGHNTNVHLISYVNNILWFCSLQIYPLLVYKTAPLTSVWKPHPPTAWGCSGNRPMFSPPTTMTSQWSIVTLLMICFSLENNWSFMCSEIQQIGWRTARSKSQFRKKVGERLKVKGYLSNGIFEMFCINHLENEQLLNDAFQTLRCEDMSIDDSSHILSSSHWEMFLIFCCWNM